MLSLQYSGRRRGLTDCKVAANDSGGRKEGRKKGMGRAGERATNKVLNHHLCGWAAMAAAMGIGGERSDRGREEEICLESTGGATHRHDSCRHSGASIEYVLIGGGRGSWKS